MKNKPMLFIGVLLVIAMSLIVFYQVITNPFGDMELTQQKQPHNHGQENLQKMSFSEEMKTYGKSCANCHGKLGEGLPGYPALQSSQLSLEEIKDIIVNGKGKMEGLSHIKEPMLTKLAKFVKKL